MVKRTQFLSYFFVLFFCFLGFSSEKDSLQLSIPNIDASILSQQEALVSQRISKGLSDLDNLYPTSNFIMDHSYESQELSYDNLEIEFPVDEKLKEARAAAEDAFSEIKKVGGWIEKFSVDHVHELPVGVSKKIANVTYQVGFTHARFTKDYTELTVFAKVILPQSKDKTKDGEKKEEEQKEADDEEGKVVLFFGGDKIRISNSGGLIGDTSLVLLGDVHIPFNENKWMLSLNGAFDKASGNITRKTYMTINCDGFQEMGIDGSVAFSRNFLQPVNAQGVVMAEGRVKGDFKMVAADWNDILVDVSLSPFVLTDYKEKFVFEVDQAVFDFSDVRNSDFEFPDFYEEDQLLSVSKELWRGVYVKRFMLGVPEEFETKDGTGRVKFEAHDLLIDDQGISGLFIGHDIFPLEEGVTSKKKGWSYSLDKFTLTLEASVMTKTEFTGEIIMPVTEQNVRSADGDGDLGLAYDGLISVDEFKMNISLTESVKFDIWSAEAHLTENSYIDLRVVEGNFRPKANLNGSIDISGGKKDRSGNEGKKIVDFKGVLFQSLVLQTEAPYIQADYFGYEGDLFNVSNFPVSIKNPGLVIQGNHIDLEFDLGMNLMEKADKSITAVTRLIIKGEVDDESDKFHVNFKGVGLDEISLDADLGGFKLDGQLTLMNDDPVYGDGFSADLDMTLGAIGDTKIKTKAIFGKKDFRYWYFDALVSLPPSASQGVVTLKGFGGGASYRMTRDGFSSEFSPSGLAFKPSRDSGLSLKAMVMLNIGSDKAATGEAGFEIEFNRNGGVNRLGLYGKVEIMASLNIPNPAAAIADKMKSLPALQKVTNDLSTNELTKNFVDKSKEDYPATVEGQGGIMARLAIDFDFQNKSLHGTLETYINIGSVLTGIGPGGRSGLSVVHIDPQDWYIYIGTPSDPQGVRLGIGSLSMESSNYFMIGSILENSPPPPIEVAEALGVELSKLDSTRNLNLLESGGGFAFGSRFKVDTGNIKFLMFYSRLAAGAGFDLMIREYPNTVCSNTGDQIGINGWYANGQAYAYFQGEVGIRVRIFRKKKNISILSLQAAVLIQAQGPKPFWMKGYVGGSYNVLGGLVKGECNFEVVLGEKCEMKVSQPFGGLEIITQVKPENHATEIDVFSTPQITFSMPIDQVIRIREDNDDDDEKFVYKDYKIVIDEFKILDKSTNQAVVGRQEWDVYKKRMTFIPDDVLPPRKDMQLVCQVSFLEKVDGIFKTLKYDGEKAIERKDYEFKTGEAPTYIPLDNIDYSYPLIGQKNVYPEESNTGYIKLIVGQDYLFEDTSNWDTYVSALDKSTGDTVRAEMTYDTAENKVNYGIPDMENRKDYVFRIVSKPNYKIVVDDSLDTTSTTTSLEGSNTVTITKHVAKSITQEGVIERITHDIKTSYYDTFEDKIKDIDIDQYFAAQTADYFILSNKVKDMEPFTISELSGSQYSKYQPLVKVEAVMDDKYFTDDVNPVLYEKHPLGSKYTITRNPEAYGFIPTKAFNISNYYLSSVEQDTDLYWRTTRFPFLHHLSSVYYSDFRSVRDRVLNDHVNEVFVQPSMRSIIDHHYLSMRRGYYKVNIYYTLPGATTPNSTTRYKYKNPINYRDENGE